MEMRATFEYAALKNRWGNMQRQPSQLGGHAREEK
jgi:hypothetical protein